jgi:hypothetical protein
MDGLIEKIILGSIAAGILMYMLAYVFVPAFSTVMGSDIVGIASATLQGIFFILFIVIVFSFVLLFVYQSLKKE